MEKEESMKPVRTILTILLAAALPLLTSCGSDPAPKVAKSEPKVEKKKPPEPLTGKHVVIMETTKGDITMELDADAAPKSVENFLGYVDKKFYDNSLFHRVRKRFMVQGGGFSLGTAGLQRKWTQDPIPNESSNGLSNMRGAVAMARSEDPSSATSQFFINLRNNKQLDPAKYADGIGYCVFGKVLEGMDVADAIGNVKIEAKGSQKSLPAVPVFIKKIRRAPAEEAATETSGD
jgi:cyclophilin family peptidyl-prolyl cis-trans isomerase